MKEEKIFFKNNDALKLCGILTTPENNTDKAIILCHGLTVTKEEGGIFTNLAKKLVKKGFAVLRFDFRSHGESEGSYDDFTVSGEIKDVEAAYEFMKSKGYKNFGILAASFGGGPTVYFAFEHPEIKAFVLWNPLIDYDSLLNPTLPWPKRNFNKEKMEQLNREGYIEIGSRKCRLGKPLFAEIKNLKPYEKLKDISIPVLFVHGDKDTYVPYTDSVKYSEMIGAQLETIKNGEHGFHDTKENSDKADAVTIEFFKKWMN